MKKPRFPGAVDSYDHPSFRQFLQVTAMSVSCTSNTVFRVRPAPHSGRTSEFDACTDTPDPTSKLVGSGVVTVAVGAGSGHVPASFADSRHSVRASVVAAWVQFEWSMFRRVRVAEAVSLSSISQV